VDARAARPVVVNGAYVVTTPITGPWMYYQLSR